MAAMEPAHHRTAARARVVAVPVPEPVARRRPVRTVVIRASDVEVDAPVASCSAVVVAVVPAAPSRPVARGAIVVTDGVAVDQVTRVTVAEGRAADRPPTAD